MSRIESTLQGLGVQWMKTVHTYEVAKVQALADAVKALLDAAAGTSGVPSLAQLQLLGVTGVNESNLAAYQAALRGSADDGSGTDSLAELQSLVPVMVAMSHP